MTEALAPAAKSAAAFGRKCCRFWLKVLPLWGLGLLLAVVCATTSCERDTAYHTFRPVSAHNWTAGDTLFFEIPVRDSLPQYDFYVEVRHSVSYPYRELLLAVEWFYRTSRGESPVRCHVVRYLLADERGRWLGTGWGSLRVSAAPVSRLRFLRSGTLCCRVYHLMNAAQLPGIDHVGLRLSKR